VTDPSFTEIINGKRQPSPKSRLMWNVLNEMIQTHKTNSNEKWLAIADLLIPTLVHECGATAIRRNDKTSTPKGRYIRFLIAQKLIVIDYYYTDQVKTITFHSDNYEYTILNEPLEQKDFDFNGFIIKFLEEIRRCWSS